MPLAPHSWNVVVLGSWNPGILTPHGVITKLFQLPPDTEVGMEVPLYAVAPPRISNGGLVVVAGSNSLAVEAQAGNYESLGSAARLAHRAMDILPETPVTAAGFNIRYLDAARQAGGAFASLLEHRLDLAFQRESLPVVRREVSRSVDWRGGKVKVDLVDEVGMGYHLLFNFECQGDRAELMRWLSLPPGDIQRQVQHVCHQILSLPAEAFA
jgi:hypothetical protein